jgi:hypothetical protein
MYSFYLGILTGYLFKEIIKTFIFGTIINSLTIFHQIRNKILKKKLQNENYLITKVNFVCKVKNLDFFNEIFKDKLKINPDWKYLKENNVIKIEMEQDFLEFLNKKVTGFNEHTNNTRSIPFEDIINLKNNDSEYLISLDLSFFKQLGEVFLYFYYSIDNKNCINVYGENDTLLLDDFIIQENNPSKDFFDNLICATLKTNKVKGEYITNYLKMFFNNKNNLTPEAIFYNYDKIPFNTYDNMVITCIIDKSVLQFKSNDLIKYLKND